MSKTEKKYSSNPISFGLVFGAGLGLIFGQQYGNIGLGMVFGIVMGLAIGSMYKSKKSSP